MLDARERDACTIHCADGVGQVEVNVDALTEAIFRWRRGEKREALHYLEEAFGSDYFRDLGEINIGDLR